MTHCHVKYTGRGTIWLLPGERHWSWYHMPHCQGRGTDRGTVWQRLTHDHVGNENKISINSEPINVFDNIYAFVSIGNARLLTSMWLITFLGYTWHCCSLGVLSQRFCSILCRSIIKMATISRGYVNLLPPWYFKITLSYIIHVLAFTKVTFSYADLKLSQFKDQLT